MKDHTLPASLFWWCIQGLESTLVAILLCKHFCKDASVARPKHHSNELEKFSVDGSCHRSTSILRGVQRFCFSLGHPLHIETFCCSATPHTSNSSPFTTSQITSTLFPHHINTGEKTRGGDTLSDSIDCSELNWDCGLVTVVPVSLAGVDSLDKTRFCVSLSSPSHILTFCCSATPHISNSSPFTTSRITSTLLSTWVDISLKMTVTI